MKKEYDFSKGKRGAVVATTGKTRITLWIDDDILAKFRSLSEKTGRGNQTLINEALSRHARIAEPAVTAAVVRKIVREELTRT